MAGTRQGVKKAHAIRKGIDHAEYVRQELIGNKWCTGCKAFHAFVAFGSDASRPDGLAASCVEARRQRYRRTYTPHPLPPGAKPGPPPAPARDGDKKQARRRVNVEVRSGYRPHPNDLPCARCGHVWAAGERRHEYDHHRGYGAQHHSDVVPLCTTCHTATSISRGEFNGFR